jgi:hypothetical protein
VASQTPGQPDDVRGSVREGAPATLMEQFGRTKSSFSRLVSAHVGLLRAEIGEILDQVKVMGTLAGVALAVILMVGNMLYIGGFLFMGEWLFGSIGWGLAHGVLFGLALVVALVLGILGAGRGSAAAAFLIATVLTVAIALLLGFNVANNAASSVAPNLPSPIDSAGAVSLIAGVVIGALVFALLLWRVAGGAGAIGGLIVGAILGALVGWLMGGAPWTWPPAAGFAITIGLIAWPILQAVLAIPRLDLSERFGRLYPRQSIEAANETRAWLEEQWRSRQPKLGRK